jgi:hypothetical protein
MIYSSSSSGSEVAQVGAPPNDRPPSKDPCGEGVIRLGLVKLKPEPRLGDV